MGETKKVLSESELVNELEKIYKSDSIKGKRHYTRQFKSVYKTVRKSLVAIKKGRKATGSKKAVRLTKEVLQSALDSLN